MTNPSETKLVERLRDHENEGVTSSDRYHLREEAATALASLADELRLEREDAERYRWLQDWYLREGKRSEIDEFGHIRQTTALIMDASIDAALKEPS